MGGVQNSGQGMPGYGGRVRSLFAGPDGEDVELTGRVVSLDPALGRASVAWEPNVLGVEMSAHLPCSRLAAAPELRP